MTYKGTEPPPDTFKDDAQALALGTYGRDGVFHANGLQAKCASKYAPAHPTPRREAGCGSCQLRAPRHRQHYLPMPAVSQLSTMTRTNEAASSTLCARLDQVSKLFGSFAALRQVSVDLEPGRCYVLLGENGAGKSTLLRILAGLLRPSMARSKSSAGSTRTTRAAASAT